ncbi:MAG: single-stranded DNA-binding protein [Oscillospiraceae bacterium]|nr:single-stranded DNA-binding protein [Oscillospiraceae bacterium]
MNKVILMGRLVNDPEFSVGQNGNAYCRFRIAVDRSFARQGEQRQSDFFRITCFGKIAEFVNQYFVKGKPVLIEGKIQNNNYTDKNGVQHYGDDIIADTVNFVLSDPTRNNNQSNYNNNYNNGGYQNYGGNSNSNYGYSSGNYNNNNNNYNSGQNYRNNGNNGYQDNPGNFGNDQPAAPGNPPKDIQLGSGSFNDFEEIISDGQVPF